MGPFNPKQIHVKHRAMIPKDMNESKRGAGDLLFTGHSKSADDALCERRLSGAEISGKENDQRRTEAGGKLLSQSKRLSR